jgi:chemotaxis protein CheD
MGFDLVNVGIADLAVAREPVILRTILGSCVGICLYDGEEKLGGLAHIMLPEMKPGYRVPKKYADTAIPMLIEEMEKEGGSTERITAKLVGGARMFNLSENSMMGDIGRHNLERTRQVLAEFNIEVLTEDVQGTIGRTIDFYTSDGSIRIKSINQEERFI